MPASQNSVPSPVSPRHKGLKSWKSCHELVLAVYRATADWPRREQYGLIAQARRAAYSAAANIAEGSAKRGSREFCRFLDISLGSIAELSYTLLLARDWITSNRRIGERSKRYEITLVVLPGGFIARFVGDRSDPRPPQLEYRSVELTCLRFPASPLPRIPASLTSSPSPAAPTR
jgi:four helix bundle protein